MKHLRKYNESQSDQIQEIIKFYEEELSDIQEEQKDNIVERFKRGERDSHFMPSANDNYEAGKEKGKEELIQELLVKLNSLL